MESQTRTTGRIIVHSISLHLASYQSELKLQGCFVIDDVLMATPISCRRYFLEAELLQYKQIGMALLRYLSNKLKLHSDFTQSIFRDTLYLRGK